MTYTCPQCQAEAEVDERISFPETFGGKPSRPDRLILDCPNCGTVTVN
ncbi:hypothetical protein [Mycobacterium sp. 852014-52144_SCH5372336]|nr:hypothetical protein [Mycobacterium sp. 852014-52144_SCH5372336]